MDDLALSKTHRVETHTPSLSDTYRMDNADNDAQNKPIDDNYQDEFNACEVHPLRPNQIMTLKNKQMKSENHLKK